MDIKKILIACVTYNSNNELLKFLESIETSLGYAKEKNIDLTVCIADNSEVKTPIKFQEYSYHVQYFPYNNLGYLGSATNIINGISDILAYDFIIISNVDLTVDISFFKKIPFEIDKQIAWISPSILSNYENRDKGIGIATRPSKTKLILLKVMYKYPWIHFLVENTIYKRKKIIITENNPEIKDIYSGHGSFIILTKSFFLSYPKIHYPMFLYGEELFLGELIRISKLKVIYNPNLIIYDNEHVSTSKLPSSFASKCQYDSMAYLLDTFYRE